MIHKSLTLIAGALCLILSAQALSAQSANWKLLETTQYGVGGFWQDGQKVRIDRSVKGNSFSYERKVSSSRSIALFSSKGEFSALKEEYAPGEALTVTVSVSASGDDEAAPAQVYGRVTILPGDPGWTSSNWSTNSISGAGAVDGQLKSSTGAFLVTPASGEVALSGKVPATGSRMAIVFSCNGMDILHLYGRDASADEAAPAQEQKTTKKLFSKKQDIEDDTAADDEQQVAQEKPKKEKAPKEDKTPGETNPRVKIILLAALLLAAIIDLLYMFSKPKK